MNSRSETITVDVMFLYTAQVRVARGLAAVEDAILYSVACANETFRRSQIPVRLRLVHVAEVPDYKESGRLANDLSWLITNQTVAALQDQYGADLVSLMVRTGDFAGVAEPGRAYSVYKAVWNGGPSTFTHELGHNFGCSHDRSRGPVCPRDPYSYGYSFTPPGSHHTYGTIMSTVGVRILNFSNPRVGFAGVPTGLPEGTRDDAGRDISADNARTILNAAPEIAARKPNRVNSLEQPLFTDGGTRFSFEFVVRQPGTYWVEHTVDFISWHPLHQVASAGGVVKITDAVTAVDARFYRIRSHGRCHPQPIGFYRRAVPAGYSLIANQLDCGDNRIEQLFSDLPVGTELSKWDASALQFVETTLLASGWTQPDLTLHPGEGAVLRAEHPLTLTFMGEVQSAVFQPVGLGWSLISSPVPQSGPIISTLHFPETNPSDQEEIHTLAGDPAGYQRWSCQDGSWQPSPAPHIGIGEAFWAYLSPNAPTWKRIFLPLQSAPVPEILRPALCATFVQSGSIALSIKGEPNTVYHIMGSANLVDWVPLGKVTNQFEQCYWLDPADEPLGVRFYRAAIADR